MSYTGLARVVLVVGGVLLWSSEAVSRVPQEQTRPEALQPRAGQGPESAAKCRCSSAADCTCKKGECKCKSCKPSRQVLERLQGQAQQPAPPPAREQASAGFTL